MKRVTVYADYGSQMALYDLGLTKTAIFGPEQAHAVLQVAKLKQLPKAALRSFGGNPGPGLSAIGTAKNVSADLAQQHNKITAIYGERMADISTRRLRADALAASKAVPQGAIMQKGSISKLLRDMPRVSKTHPSIPLTPNQHKMMEAVGKGHELDEIAARPGQAFRSYGHYSPEVILREHNRLVTMPEAYAPVKQIFKSLRADREANALTNYIDYGESPRLSRHAIRRITEQMENALPQVERRQLEAKNVHNAAYNRANRAARPGQDPYDAMLTSSEVTRFNPKDTFEQYTARKAQRAAENTPQFYENKRLEASRF